MRKRGKKNHNKFEILSKVRKREKKSQQISNFNESNMARASVKPM
jgi:hypothetical protein